VSPTMYKKLQEIGSPKLKKEGSINLVKIENGVIAEESKRGAKEVRKELFYDSFVSRFNNERSILFPEGFDLIVDCRNWDEGTKNECVSKNEKIFDNVTVIESGDFGDGFYHALYRGNTSHQKVFIDTPAVFSDILKQTFSDTVINPGTLHYCCDPKDCDLIQEADRVKSGNIAMFSVNANALKRIGRDSVLNAKDFEEIKKAWSDDKVIAFNTSIVEDTGRVRLKKGVKYAVYGAGRTGEAAKEKISSAGSEIVFFVDSDETKWGSFLGDIEIISPDMLTERKNDYDQVMIASTFYKEILDRIVAQGFSEEDIAIFE
ncbi:MAG: hypothetical protein K6F00_10110, partial [Lachnospiraceae bacterium]|nr:hypothetical protein [Lachnospiraceae bacterium]